jgi:hypothetical protein
VDDRATGRPGRSYRAPVGTPRAPLKGMSNVATHETVSQRSGTVASRIASLERLIKAEGEIRHHPVYGISASRLIAAARTELAELRHPHH